MKFLLIITGIIILFTNCTKESPVGEVFSVGVDIFIENENGENLLSKNTPNHYDENLMRVSYVINGNSFIAYDGDLDCPSMICVTEELGETWVGILTNYTDTEDYPLTYIHWNESDTDTLKCHYIRNEHGTVCDEVWFNGEKMFPDKAIVGYDRGFKIIK